MNKIIIVLISIAALVGSFFFGYCWYEINNCKGCPVKETHYMGNTYTYFDSGIEITSNKNGWEIVSDGWSKGYKVDGRLVVLDDSLLQRDLIKILENYIKNK